jgi:F-type H+-transporting ATPase subunit b
MHLDWWTIGLQTINFAILVWLLHRFLYRPVLSMIDARKADIALQYDNAKAAEQQAKTRLADVEAQRVGIAADREAALRAAGAQAQEAAEARRAQAERDAQALLDDGRKTLAAERERALAEARKAALDLGAEFAQRLLADVPMQLRAEARIERVEQYIDALEQSERDALVRQLADGRPLTVVTAAPVAAPTTDLWTERLHRKLGSKIAVVFAVRPEIIAGVELHFPDAILRFTWQSALAAARSELGAHADAH